MSDNTFPFSIVTFRVVFCMWVMKVSQEIQPLVLQWFMLEPVGAPETLTSGVLVSHSAPIQWPCKLMLAPFVRVRQCSGERNKSPVIPAIVWPMLLWSRCPQCHFSRWCYIRHLIAFNFFRKCFVWSVILALLTSSFSGAMWHGRTWLIA